MIIVTGAAGFIGSCLVTKLNNEGRQDLILVDKFDVPEKQKNLEGKKYSAKVERDQLEDWLKRTTETIEVIFHIGARTDTTEFNWEVLEELNLNYTKMIWNYCSEKQTPLIYASSAATYGLGEFGYEDNHEVVSSLKPLNPYGESKNEFDKWAVSQDKCPPDWYGLKFFNVYGPNEYHKGRMASVILHTFKQVQEKGQMNLFRSHNPEYKDGEQLRDFVYVKDVINVCWYLYTARPESGIYNLGSGKARTFLDLATATFRSLNKPANISFIDTPIDIRDKYQYFTEADMSKLLKTGYNTPFHTLEEGVKDYVENYLLSNRYY
ncbi:MAG: ADP-glyceromanno-heptose 6-epimerase [Flavobacteriia bacterium]|nr:ADP-glyceromanno-heptose 6-epimerase [Flavobacteriia bacterium]OJX36169.1 MAG: ADP-glyceromanno-heptose 6-epimerase [Flavobacteriia bacterium 40-80]